MLEGRTTRLNLTIEEDRKGRKTRRLFATIAENSDTSLPIAWRSKANPQPPRSPTKRRLES